MALTQSRIIAVIPITAEAMVDDPAKSVAALPVCALPPAVPLAPALVLTAVTLARKLFHAAIVADGKVYVDCVVPEPL